VAPAGRLAALGKNGVAPFCPDTKCSRVAARPVL